MTTESRVIIAQSNDTLIIPANALIDENGTKFVLVALDEIGTKSEKRAVKIGISDSVNVEILDGVGENDMLIIHDESRHSQSKKAKPQSGPRF